MGSGLPLLVSALSNMALMVIAVNPAVEADINA